MATQFLNATFDGATDVARLSGQSAVAWSTGSLPTIDRYSVFVEQPDELDATVNFTGSNWRVRHFQVAGDDHITRIRDLDNGAGRVIEYMNLGYNSDVDLTSTKVRYMDGWDGDLHDITLGPQNDWMHWMNLGALVNKVDTAVGWLGGVEVYRGMGDFTVRGGVGMIDFGGENDRLVVDGGQVFSTSMQGGNDTIIVRNGGRVELLTDFGGNSTITLNANSRIDTFRGGDGNVSFTLNGNGRAETINTFNANLTLKSADGWIRSIGGHDVSSNITIGDGGSGAIKFTASSAQSHKITGSANGYIASIDLGDFAGNPNDDQSSVINVKYFVGSILLGNGNDKVTTGNGETGYVGSIQTGGGKDIVTLGSGGSGKVSLGDGNDKVNVKDLFYNEEEDGVVLRGGDGIDELNFAKFSKAVTFTMNGSITNQELAKDSGFLTAFGFEKLSGSKFNDDLTGNAKNNVLKGLNGKDALSGMAGNDKLIGAAGNDTLSGGLGKDVLLGGKGGDILNGDQGDDVLRGQAGQDVFVFGANSGTDTVKDYVDNFDKLRIADHNGGFQTLAISALQGDKIIVHDGGTIILDGKAGVTLTASDFDFV